MQYANTVGVFHRIRIDTLAHTHTHTNTQEECGPNEARGDTAELSVKPQLADVQSTTSMTSFLRRGKPVQSHQMWREV